MIFISSNFYFQASDSFDCDFETSFCGWIQEIGDDDEFKWERANGTSSQSSPWRPKIDTTQNDQSKSIYYIRIIK